MRNADSGQKHGPGRSVEMLRTACSLVSPWLLHWRAKNGVDGLQKGSQPEGRRRARKIRNGAASCLSTRARPPKAATPSIHRSGYSHRFSCNLTGHNQRPQSLRRSSDHRDWLRLAADLLALQLGQERFTWGRASIVAVSETRQAYIRPLKAADAGDMALLLAFART